MDDTRRTLLSTLLGGVGVAALQGCSLDDGASGPRLARVDQADTSSSANAIDFVVDCGADPTGATDCTAALNMAGSMLAALAADPKLPYKSCRLVVPPGRYLIAGAPNPWDFSAWVSSGAPRCIEVVGVQDASIFECGMLGYPNYGVFQPWKFLEFRISGLTFVGTADSLRFTDTGSCIYATGGFTTIERCRFLWLATALPTVYANGGLRMVDCRFGGCQCTDPSKATVYVPAQNGIDLLNVVFIDPTEGCNGYSFQTGKDGGSCHFRVDDSTSNGFGSNLCRIVGCFFDEGTRRAVHIQGGVSRIPRVELTGNQFNPGIINGATSMVRLENIDLVEVNGLRSSGFNTLVDIAALELVGVGSAFVRQMAVNPAAVSRYIEADSATKYLEIVDSNVAVADVRSSATLTTMKNRGKTEDLYVAGAAIVAHQLCKIGAAGLAPLDSGDTLDVVIGAASSAAAQGQAAAVSRVGTPTSYLSDGTAPISVGDNLGISLTSPGRVTSVAVGTDRVGVATAAADASPDVAVAGLFAPLRAQLTSA